MKNHHFSYNHAINSIIKIINGTNGTSQIINQIHQIRMQKPMVV